MVISNNIPMASSQQIKNGRKQVAHVLSQLNDEKQVMKFLEDILTPQEFDAVAERWLLVQLLLSGKTQRDVRDELGIAIATVTRGAKQLKYGSGGFEMAANL
jgi:Trp operon repressor